MKKKFTLLVAGLSLIASSAYAALDNLENYDAVLETRFSLTLEQGNGFFRDAKPPQSEPVAEVQAIEVGPPQPFVASISSNTLLRNGGYPRRSRVFFVFQSQGFFELSGRIVIANPETGEIYQQVAEAQTISIQGLMDDFQSFVGVFEDRRGRTSLTTNMAFLFDLDGIQFTCIGLVEINSSQRGNTARVQLRNRNLVGDGGGGYQMMRGGGSVIVTRGRISARGTVDNIQPN